MKPIASPLTFVCTMMICACSNGNIRIVKESCDPSVKYDKIQIFARTQSGIDKIVAGVDTFYCKPYDPGLELDFDFEMKTGDSLRLFKGNKVYVSTQIANTHPSLEIMTNWYGGIEFYQHCNLKVFD